LGEFIKLVFIMFLQKNSCPSAKERATAIIMAYPLIFQNSSAGIGTFHINVTVAEVS
jgi:hypothetical protein